MNKPVSKDGFDRDQPEETLIRLKVMEDFKLTTYEVESLPPCIKGLRTEKGFTYMVRLYSHSHFPELAARVDWVREDGKEPTVGSTLRYINHLDQTKFSTRAYYKTVAGCTQLLPIEKLESALLKDAVTFIVEKSATYLEEKFLSELNVLDESVNWPED